MKVLPNLKKVAIPSLIKAVFLFVLFTVLVFSFGKLGRTQAAGSIGLSYSGCLSALLGRFYNFKAGNFPLSPCVKNDSLISLGNGTITSVVAGTGLTGGAASGSAMLSLGATYSLPQSCTTDQIIKWNGTAWVCASTPSKVLAKDATITGGITHQTTTPPGSPVSLPGTTVSFSASEISAPAKLAINWTGRFTNDTPGSQVDSSIYVDGVFVMGTRVVVPLAATWTQHAITKVVPVSAGAHIVEIFWDTYGGTATAADTQLSVLAIPN